MGGSRRSPYNDNGKHTPGTSSGQHEAHLVLRSPVKDVVNKIAPNRRQHKAGGVI